MKFSPLALLAAGLLLAPPTMAKMHGDKAHSSAKVETEKEQAREPMKVESVNKLLDNPAAFSGRTISIDGEIEDIKGTQSFVLDGPGWWNDEVVVISRKPLTEMATGVSEDAEVSVKGQVVQMAIIEIEREYGWDFDPEIEAELEDNRTYIVADEITVTELDD